MSWKPARDREKYGVAIYNYSGISDSCIKLNVGDTVHIQEELDGWFFGYSLQNSATRGVFPKSFIQIRECIVDKTGPVEVVSPRLPPIVQEVTAVLREWGILLRKLYLEHNKHFDFLKETMLELHAMRRRVLSGKLPVDELKKIKQGITRRIDRLNAKLGLDLVVRDESGNILNPAITSAVKLFRHHQDASEKLSKGESSTPEEAHTRRKPHLSWTILFSIKNIIIKVPEDTEISLGLYIGDPREGKERPLTESFIIPWTDGGYTQDLTFLDELKCLFTDLNTHTLENNQVWLIGTVIRHGCMAVKEMDPRKSMAGQGKKTMLTTSDFLRRPYGIIIMDLTEQIRKRKEAVLSGTPQMDDDNKNQLFASMFLCGEKETMDMKKLLSVRGDTTKDKMGFQGIWFTIQVMNGDVKQLKEANYLEVREVPVAYRLGLSDVVMPGDVRNDLYVTLQSGEFSRGSKTSDRNVEVTARVWDDRGKFVPGVVWRDHQGCRKGPLDDYRSVTYHHEPKPRWAETFKIALPVEEFKKAHIKFTFRHRSTNDAKDKSEKPFAMAFVKLIQKNGTTLQNTDHELIVYKIDNKKWSDNDSSYLGLPWLRLPGEEYGKTWQFGIAPSLKDNFTICTTFCSTKLTQNGDLLRLLEWGWHGSQGGAELEACLQGLVRVPADELMVFLQDTLDVLLEILMNNSTGDYSDNKVFEALVYVITIATDKNKHEAFQPVLDTYIQQNFHAALAYNRLIYVLKYYVQEGEKATDENKKRDSQETRRAEELREMEIMRRNEEKGTKKEEKALRKSGEEKELGRREEEVKEEENLRRDDWQETLKRSMKCLQYIFRFIIRSRQLFVDLNGRGQEEFEKSLKDLLDSMADLMTNTSNSTLTVQAQCLRSITTAIPDIITSFSPVQLSLILARMVDNLHLSRIPKQKLMTINEIIHSELFKFPECRRVLLPCFIGHLHRLMVSNDEITGTDVVMRKEKKKNKLKQILDLDKDIQLKEEKEMSEELELCSKILGDILDVLFNADIGPVYEDIGLLSFMLLEDILSVVSWMKKGDPLLGNFVSILVSLLRQMTDRHYHTFLNRYEEVDHLCAFILELLEVIEKLVKEPVFASDWAEMILLQNHVIVKVLQQFSRVIAEKLLEPFREDVWSKIFLTSINFISQSSLQLENFTKSKRNKILGRYKDMRKETALGVKGLWFSLGMNKSRFVAGKECRVSLVGPFLQMTMLPDTELRKATIPIFFDMMQCEFYAAREKTRENETPKIKQLENEMLEKLDQLVESGHGDEHYRDMFKNIIGSLCQGHATLCDTGRRLVTTVTHLLDRLLQYRTIMNTPDNSSETRMGCIVNLLDFYSEIKRKELYLRYVYKLTTLHLACENYTEAGYSLMQHTKLLHWTPEPLSQALHSPFYRHVERHDELKETLYEDIIGYFDKGKMWEDALKLCKELVKHYEEVRFEYTKLSELLTRMAIFYKNIMNPQNLRPEPEYFRVAYYGRGFPAFLQNKVFVYRGNGFERLEEFQTRILDQFRNAELMKRLKPPSEEAKESPHQYLQISKVDCVVDKDSRFAGASVSEQIISYYRANDVKTFSYSRPFHRGTRDPENEFATLCIERTTLEITYPLPGILRWFPVKHVETVELSPLENAIETMTQTNIEVRMLVIKYIMNAGLQLNPLTSKLSGIITAYVNGGTANYEKAFLSEDYSDAHPGDAEKQKQLRDLIAAQIPLLEAGLVVHGYRVTEAMQGLHSHLAETFRNMKAEVREKYGEPDMPDELRQALHPQRFQSVVSVGGEGGALRSSQLYPAATDVGEVVYAPNPPHGSLPGTAATATTPATTTTTTTTPASPRNSFTRGLFSHSTLPHKSLFMGISASHLSLSRLSTVSKGGTLPRHYKSSTSMGNGHTPKANKKEKGISRLLRRESFSSQREPSTQWFDRTDTHSPTQRTILELNETMQTIPLRPKRTELEVDNYYKTSRPSSLTLTLTPTPSTCSTPSPSPPVGSRESLTTPTGSAIEERPPLPAKQRDQEDGLGTVRLSAASLLPTAKIGGLLAFPLDLPDDPPPQKPPRPDKTTTSKTPPLHPPFCEPPPPPPPPLLLLLL
ncbi:dedicator of cytokinesis protein 1-like [Portunus trituberculatus]|uniref:dedicator of cytokinesis protein 1-like n=1 Tax=Portunus trituberculatus TaxID=210409 RepID=UPI001E1D0FB4|nr:dedicator of cytokinesis protein 1-like [Portunus trituberculatus]